MIVIGRWRAAVITASVNPRITIIIGSGLCQQSIQLLPK
jgi:hypothetical protein